MGCCLKGLINTVLNIQYRLYQYYTISIELSKKKGRDVQEFNHIERVSWAIMP